MENLAWVIVVFGTIFGSAGGWGGGGASRFFSLKEPCSNLTHTPTPTNSSLIISPFHQYTKHV